MAFQDKLRLLLEYNNITQKKLAEDLHVASSTMGGYARGVSEPDFEMLKKIADYFSVSTDYLLDYSQSSGRENTKEKAKMMDEELLKIFHSMNMSQRIIYINQGKVFADYNKKMKEKKKKKGDEQ